MRPLVFSIAAVALPLAALGQPVDFSLSCLPELQRTEAQNQARRIVDDVGKRRAALRSQISSAAEKEREARIDAMLDCADAAKKAGKSPGEQCARETEAFRAADVAQRALSAADKAALQAIDEDEKQRLSALRAQLPSC